MRAMRAKMTAAVTPADGLLLPRHERVTRNVV